MKMSPCEYIVLRSSKSHCDQYHLDLKSTDPYNNKRVKNYDQKLYRVLREIFCMRRLSNIQIRKLLRAPKKNTDKNSIFKLILEREPALGKLLLERNKLSLLWITVLSGYQESAELLLRCGADVNEVYGLNITHNKLSKKSTVLHALIKMYPSYWNKQFIVKVMDHGANLKARESDLSTVLHLAVKYGRIKLTEMLLERGVEVNVFRYANITPLLDAAQISEADKLVPLLMRYGADVHAKDTQGFNALRYLACSPGEHVDLARVLIEKGLSPREIVSNQHQPIHVAVIRGKIELVNLFLDHGADVNARGFNDEFPLYVAARECDNPEMLLTLLKRGADIDLKMYFGFTALQGLTVHHQFHRNNKSTLEKVKILLYYGASIFTKANDGSTLFDYIYRKSMENQSIKQILKTLAQKRVCLPPIMKFKDERTIKENHPVLWKYYQNCIEEINRMKATKFIESCTIYDLFQKCQCEISPLMRHQEFKRKFRWFDISVFPMYTDDILEAFERAELYHQSMLDQENLIEESTGHILPYMIVRKMSRYALGCEICELKKIVNASCSVRGVVVR